MQPVEVKQVLDCSFHAVKWNITLILNEILPVIIILSMALLSIHFPYSQRFYSSAELWFYYFGWTSRQNRMFGIQFLNIKSMFRFGQNKTDLFYGGLFDWIK